jgi:TraK protein
MRRPWRRGLGLPLAVGLWLVGLPGLAPAARTVLLTGDPIVVRLQHRQPTALTFPEPITAVPTGAEATKLSLELEGHRLFLQPLEPQVQGLLFVLGVSGRNYPIRFLVGTPADTDVVLVLQAPASLPATAHLENPVPNAPGLTVRALLAAMLRRTVPPGVTEAADRQVLLTTDRLRLTTTRVYVAGPLNGYLAEAVNRTEQPVPLLLPEYYAPGLKAITAEAEVLPPQGRTRVYLVFQPGSPH